MNKRGVCKINPEKWETGFYYDIQVKKAFPLEADVIYEFEESDKHFFKVKFNGVYYYVPNMFLIEISEIRRVLLQNLLE
jgi:hypothetical protein